MNKQKNNIIDVSYPTHGLQAGAQVHYDPSCHTWTVYLADGLERLTAIHGKHEAWSTVANLVNELQAEGNGREFVRDGLKIEIERLENGLTAFDLLSADDIHALSIKIGIDPETLYSGVAEIIATRKSEVIE